jgi:hypothetical protein
MAANNSSWHIGDVRGVSLQSVMALVRLSEQPLISNGYAQISRIIDFVRLFDYSYGIDLC